MNPGRTHGIKTTNTPLTRFQNTAATAATTAAAVAAARETWHWQLWITRARHSPIRLRMLAMSHSHGRGARAAHK